MREFTKIKVIIKKSKPWKQKSYSDKKKESAVFRNITMTDINIGFRNKQTSIRDSIYKERIR